MGFLFFFFVGDLLFEGLFKVFSVGFWERTCAAFMYSCLKGFGPGI